MKGLRLPSAAHDADRRRADSNHVPSSLKLHPQSREGSDPRLSLSNLPCQQCYDATFGLRPVNLHRDRLRDVVSGGGERGVELVDIPGCRAPSLEWPIRARMVGIVSPTSSAVEAKECLSVCGDTPGSRRPAIRRGALPRP